MGDVMKLILSRDKLELGLRVYLNPRTQSTANSTRELDTNSTQRTRPRTRPRNRPQVPSYIPGAATAISLLTPENFSKFLLNLPARSSAARSYAALSAHIPRASRNVAGTPGHDFGTLTPNTGCRSTAISFNQPLSA